MTADSLNLRIKLLSLVWKRISEKEEIFRKITALSIRVFKFCGVQSPDISRFFTGSGHGDYSYKQEKGPISRALYKGSFIKTSARKEIRNILKTMLKWFSHMQKQFTVVMCILIFLVGGMKTPDNFHWLIHMTQYNFICTSLKRNYLYCSRKDVLGWQRFAFWLTVTGERRGTW